MARRTKDTNVKKKKGASFMKNVLVLMFSQIMVKILGFIYKLVITNFEGFGDTGLGYYSAGYQVYSLLLALSSIGIPNVVSKLVSERVAIGDNKGARRIFKICMTFFTIVGLILSVILFFGAETIARVVFNVPDTKYVMQVLAPAVVFVAASAVFRGYFAGLNDMKPTSYSQILEQFLNCVLSITFVYALIGKEPYIMAAGGNLSTTCAIVLTFIYLIAYYKRKKIKVKRRQVSPEAHKTTGQLLKTILVMSIPITFSSVISIISPLIDSTTVSRCIQSAFANIYPIKEELEAFAMSMTGILSKVDTLTALPIAVNIAFSTALVPVISTSLAKKDYETASKRMTFSLFASILIIIPCACGFISLAQPILNLIYPTASDGASVFVLCSISMIFVALNQTINGGLYGVNKSYIPAVAIVLSVFIKVGLNLTLISNPDIGINGSGISSIVAQGFVFLICIIALHKNLRLNFEFGRMIVSPIAAGALMGGVVYFINKGLNTVVGNSMSTIISIICGGIIYVLALFLGKILLKEDILMIPFGTKIYPLLVRLRIYQDEPELAADGPELEEMPEETERDIETQRYEVELVENLQQELMVAEDAVKYENTKKRDNKEYRQEEKWDKEEDDFLLNLDLKEQIQRQVQEQGIPDFEKEVTLIFDRSNKMEQKVRLLFEDEILEAPREKRKKEQTKKKPVSHKQKRVKENKQKGKHSK
ncbi:MAG: polysaccharide biosynthesis protein [Clostridia bacterium]|jgi:stage V sporulation protein B|nr:polysaccharide biosynthesis protein [Clostridia bacterium]MCI9413362.1 polysaccharide biosynthesis protein [Clostridia bacterium]